MGVMSVGLVGVRIMRRMAFGSLTLSRVITMAMSDGVVSVIVNIGSVRFMPAMAVVARGRCVVTVSVMTVSVLPVSVGGMVVMCVSVSHGVDRMIIVTMRGRRPLRGAVVAVVVVRLVLVAHGCSIPQPLTAVLRRKSV